MKIQRILSKGITKEGRTVAEAWGGCRTKQKQKHDERLSEYGCIWKSEEPDWWIKGWLYEKARNQEHLQDNSGLASGKKLQSIGKGKGLNTPNFREDFPVQFWDFFTIFLVYMLKLFFAFNVIVLNSVNVHFWCIGVL